MYQLDSETVPDCLVHQIEKAFTVNPNQSRVLHGKRKIVEGQRGRRTSLFPSAKCGGHIPLESQLELAHAIVLERDPTVRDYRTQAIKVDLPEGYVIPDFVVRRRNGALEIHEVKPDLRHLSEDCQLRFSQLGHIAKQSGIVFRIIDSRNLPDTKELDLNLWLYHRGHLEKYSKGEVLLASKLLRETVSETEARSILLANSLSPQLWDYLSFHNEDTPRLSNCEGSIHG